MHRNDPPSFTGGIFATSHRPMFLVMAIWAVAVVGWWQWGESGGPDGNVFGSPTLWHAHELAFGFAGAAFAGYTLTAAPSWSHRPPAAGVPIAILTALWIIARISVAGAMGPPSLPVALATAAFFIWLAFLLGHEAAAGRSVKGALQAAFAVLLGVADVAVILGLSGPRTAILVFALILSVVGGRMVRAFTDNRTVAAADRPLPRGAGEGHVGASAIAVALGASVAGAEAIAGLALVAAALAEAFRLLLWQRAAIRHDALLLMLHLGYLWLPVGLLLTGLAHIGQSVLGEAEALHALTAGAMACLIYAVAARAVARRGPHRLIAGWASISGFVALWLAACLRLAQGAFPDLGAIATHLWIAGWVVFLMTLLPTLRGAPQRPVFSGPRA